MMQSVAIRSANSMKHFADGDETFCFGDWRSWEAACRSEGRTIPLAEFKALPKDKRLEYLGRHRGVRTQGTRC